MSIDAVQPVGNEFEGRVGLVTGASSGIGEATARRLAALGTNVVINSSSSVEARETPSATMRRRPHPRSATPDDIAEAVLALLRNGYITGQALVVDGGLTQVL